jgi:phospholipase C
MRCTLFKSRLAAVAGMAFFFSACTGNSGFSSSPTLPLANQQAVQSPLQRVHRRASSTKIQHIVIIVQENRSFNNLFYGVPGAHTVKYGYTSNGQKIKLQPVGLETRWDIEHDSAGFFAACNGTGSYPGTDCQMNGFNNESWGCSRSGGSRCPDPIPPYSYVPHSETKPYFDMASQYVLADEMFASNFDASSFISHQYIISGQAESAVNFPAGAWGCPGGSSDNIGEVGPERQIPHGYEEVCWNPTTLGDELDKADISWAYYAVSYSGDYPGIWSAYQAIDHIYNGPDWKKNIISPPSQFLKDVANGNLRTVSWVTPTCANSDHAGCGSNTGPAWVASLVNAIGESKYWGSTAIFILWDDYGGWYDPVKPRMVDYDGLGLRIPMLIISPYAKKGFVSHVHYEHGTILKFVEDQFGLPRLAASDKRANSPKDAFDFSKPPRAFVTIPSGHSKNYFIQQPLDFRPPDSE